MTTDELEAHVATWVPRGAGISPAVIALARLCVVRSSPPASRIPALLWSVSRLGAWAESVA